MIRAASPDDLEDLARVERGAAHAPWSEEALRGSLASPTCRAFLAGEPAAGWALGSAVAGEGELLAIAVLPEARRQGHARELLAALERWWREQGVERAWLEVRVDNAPALALYEAAGWRRTGLRRGYYRDGADAAVLAWSPGALGATCPGTGDPDAPFQRRPVAERVLVVVELWAHGAPAGWTEAALDAMDARGLPAMVVVPAGEPDPALLPLLDRVSRSPHELALLVPGALVPRDGQGSVGPVRDAVRAVEKVSEPAKTVLAPIGSRITEALLVRAGFRTLVDLAGPATATGRLAGHFEGQAPVDVVLPGGPYDDACGPDPRSAPFLPSAGDRAADAIARADAAPGVPVVRVALDGSGAGPDDARVLGRWLDEVLLPSGARVVTAEEARVRLLAAMRNPGSVQPPSPTAGARRVDAAALRAAAGELRGATALPRTLPSDLSLTELFAGLVLLEAGETEADVVRLRGLAGPVSPATTTLGGEVTVDRRALHDLAVSLVASWPHEVPSALPVGGRLLTASELLVALASAAVGDDPVVTRPVDPPDPNQRGLGWGSSTLP